MSSNFETPSLATSLPCHHWRYVLFLDQRCIHYSIECHRCSTCLYLQDMFIASVKDYIFK